MTWTLPMLLLALAAPPTLRLVLSPGDKRLTGPERAVLAVLAGEQVEDPAALELDEPPGPLAAWFGRAERPVAIEQYQRHPAGRGDRGSLDRPAGRSHIRQGPYGPDRCGRQTGQETLPRRPPPQAHLELAAFGGRAGHVPGRRLVRRRHRHPWHRRRIQALPEPNG